MRQKKGLFSVEDWGGYAKCYDVLNDLKPYQELQKEVVRNLEFGGGVILDASCGTGNMVWWARQLGVLWNTAKVVGVDFSDEMLARAQSKNNGGCSLHLKVDINQTLPFADATFDSISSVNTLYAVSNPRRVLTEFCRVLKPEHGIVLVNLKPGYENGLILKAHSGDIGPNEPWLNAHVSAFKELELLRRAFASEEAVARFMSIAEANRRISKNAKFWFLSDEELFQLFGDCGFCDIETKPVYANQAYLVTARKELSC